MISQMLQAIQQKWGTYSPWEGSKLWLALIRPVRCRAPSLQKQGQLALAHQPHAVGGGGEVCVAVAGALAPAPHCLSLFGPMKTIEMAIGLCGHGPGLKGLGSGVGKLG